MSKRILLVRLIIVYLLVVGLLLYLKDAGMDYFATWEVNRPKIETGNAIINKNGINVKFDVVFKTLGNHRFSEYGVVYLMADEAGDFIPTIDDRKFIFITKPRLGTISEEHDKSELIISTALHVYYRAYILLDDGQAVYGDIKHLVA